MIEKEKHSDKKMDGSSAANGNEVKQSNTVASRKERIRSRYSADRDLSRVKVIPANPSPSLYNPINRQKIVIYCRVSTDSAEQTSSFELQKNYYLRMVRKRPDWKLVGLYCDEGISATSTEKRVGLLTMLEDAREGLFDVIIVKNTSRLCRNLMDCMNIVYELRSLPKPVGILFESEGLYTLDRRNDMILNILSMIAQEESRLKAESMNASVKARFSQGQFLTPAPLGFDNDEDGGLVINDEEARTVQIISMLYLNGMPVKAIIGILESLGRRTKTKKLKDGTIKEGSLKWTVSSVLGILKNERICGDVLAQKTWTPNFLDHKAKKNTGDLPQYYESDHHQGIVSHEHYEVLQRMIAANKGAKNMELPTFSIHEEGAFQGYISSVPGWRGFSVEDYNRAGLRASGIAEEKLKTLEEEILTAAEAKEAEKLEQAQKFHNEFRNQYTIDSDDYLNFPDVDDEALKSEAEDEISFTNMLTSIQDSRSLYSIERKRVSNYDLSNFEVVRAEMFSLQNKVNVLLDQGGMSFNKACLKAFDDVEAVEILYNPLDKAIIVKASEPSNPKALHWVKCGKDKTMRRCTSRGLCDAVFINMRWNQDYKYRVIGMPFVFGEEKYLFFSLESPITIVKIGTQKVAPEDVRAGIVQNENLSYAQRLADEFHVVADDVVDAKRVSRSVAIYYDEHKDHGTDRKVSVSELGSEKYAADFIKEMMENGLTPKEGWHYLDGMMQKSKRSFRLFPPEMSDSYGSSFYDRREAIFLDKLKKSEGHIVKEEIEYGWTVGVDIPSRETVNAAIEELRVAKATLM